LPNHLGQARKTVSEESPRSKKLNKSFNTLNQDVQKCCIKYRSAIHPAAQQNYVRRAKKVADRAET
jgi:hypothetical protein